MLLKAAPELEPSDFAVMPTSVTGEDLWMSPQARRVFPLSIEGKNCEKTSPWEWMAQAESNAGHHYPVVVFSRNHEKRPMCMLRFDDFLKLITDQAWLEKREQIDAPSFVDGVMGSD